MENQNAKHKLAQNGEVCTGNVKRLEIKVLDVGFRDKIKRKNPKERLPCKPFLGMNKNVFLHVIRFICHTINM